MAKGIFVITGPTATGKTALGVLAAKALDGEVISADAMQLYRGMVIGTPGRSTAWAVMCRRPPDAPTTSWPGASSPS